MSQLQLQSDPAELLGLFKQPPISPTQANELVSWQVGAGASGLIVGLSKLWKGHSDPPAAELSITQMSDVYVNT